MTNPPDVVLGSHWRALRARHSGMVLEIVSPPNAVSAKAQIIAGGVAHKRSMRGKVYHVPLDVLRTQYECLDTPVSIRKDNGIIEQVPVPISQERKQEVVLAQAIENTLGIAPPTLAQVVATQEIIDQRKRDHRAKITPEQLEEVLDLLRQNESYKEIARSYGVQDEQIRRIAHKYGLAHSTRPRGGKPKLTPEQLADVLERLRRGESYKAIAGVVQMTDENIRLIAHKHGLAHKSLGQKPGPKPKVVEPMQVAQPTQLDWEVKAQAITQPTMAEYEVKVMVLQPVLEIRTIKAASFFAATDTAKNMEGVAEVIGVEKKP